MVDRAHAVVTVTIEYVTHELGHWCRDCALPSGMRMWLAVRGPRGMNLQSRVWCDDCGGPNVVIDDEHRIA